MKRILFSFCAVTLFACGPAPSVKAPTITLAKGTATLDSTVANVKTGKGEVYCALFNAPDGFPGASPIIGGGLKAASSAAQVSCRFENLPAGDYAISVYQDENSDGELNLNAFGAPTELYGASNNVLHATSAPTFTESKLHLEDGQTVTATITMK